MYKKRTFGPLLVFVIIIALVVLLVTQTNILSHTPYFVSGSGEELIQNVIQNIQDGNRIIVINRRNTDNFNHLIDRVYDDPELFWVDMTYNAFSAGQISVLVLRDKYENIDMKQKEIEMVTKNVISTIISDDMSEYDKVLAIHDWLCDNVVYKATANDSDQDVYGALVLKEARCAGYAKAFAYLLEQVGIKSQVVSGESIDRNGTWVAHAWNLVYIDGVPYYFDITWDDYDTDIGYVHSWFGLPSGEFRMSHFPYGGYYWIESTRNDACYYIKNNMYVEKYTSSNIAAQIMQQGESFSVKCANPNVLADVIDALNDNNELQKIMRAADIDYIKEITYLQDTHSNCLHIQIVR